MDINKLFITEITGIYTTVYDHPVRLQMTDRANCGLSFAIYGKIVYHHNGKEYLLDREHALFYPIHASYELECQIPGRFTLVNFQCTEQGALNEFVSLKISDTDYFLKNHILLEKLDLVSKQYHQSKCLSLLYDTLSHLQENLQEKKILPILRTADRYITDHLSDPGLSNGLLAAHLGISEVYFRKLFKSGFGISPGQYIQNQRLEHAKDLLTASRLSVTEISNACGYTSIYHFCRTFKKQTGYTPSAFRELFRNSCL